MKSTFHDVTTMPTRGIVLTNIFARSMSQSTGHIDIGENRVDIEHVYQEEADKRLIFYDGLQLIHVGSPWLFRR